MVQHLGEDKSTQIDGNGMRGGFGVSNTGQKGSNHANTNELGERKGRGAVAVTLFWGGTRFQGLGDVFTPLCDGLSHNFLKLIIYP